MKIIVVLNVSRKISYGFFFFYKTHCSLLVLHFLSFTYKQEGISHTFSPFILSRVSSTLSTRLSFKRFSLHFLKNNVKQLPKGLLAKFAVTSLSYSVVHF